MPGSRTDNSWRVHWFPEPYGADMTRAPVVAGALLEVGCSVNSAPFAADAPQHRRLRCHSLNDGHAFVQPDDGQIT